MLIDHHFGVKLFFSATINDAIIWTKQAAWQEFVYRLSVVLNAIRIYHLHALYLLEFTWKQMMMLFRCSIFVICLFRIFGYNMRWKRVLLILNRFSTIKFNLFNILCFFHGTNTFLVFWCKKLKTLPSAKQSLSLQTSKCCICYYINMFIILVWQ